MIHSVTQAIRTFLESAAPHTLNDDGTATVPRILVAYSGGLDSSVVLHAFHQAREHFNFELEAVHVDHQLQQVSSEWAAFCEKQCAQYRINCHFEVVQIDQASGESLEALAREARYQVFENLMDVRTYLITAHHADDQFETLLLQLLRGAGPKGLSSMSGGRNFSFGQHLRPLLNISRAQLESYAHKHALEFVSDTSNYDVRFDRNYLRNELIPVIKKRFPGAQKAVLRSVRHIAIEHEMLSGFLNNLLNEICHKNVLNLLQWKKYELNLRSLLVRHWLSSEGVQMPSTKILETILLQLGAAHGESKTLIKWGNVEIRTYANSAYLLKHIDEIIYREQSATPLNASESILLMHDYGQFSFKCKCPNSPELRLGFRSGGEKLRLSGHTHHISLKQLLQKKKVLPWMRSRIPLLFEDQDLVAVGDLWLNADWLEQHKCSDFKVIWKNRPQIFV